MIRDPLQVFLKDFSEDEEIVFEWEGGSRTLRGIFDDGFIDAETGETVLDTTQPRVTCAEADSVGIPREAMTTIRGKAYSVSRPPQPDGTGFAVIQLAHEP